MKRRIYYGWIVVAVTFLTMSLVSPLATTFQLFYQVFKDQFQWSHASISGIFGLHQLLNGLLSPLVGWMLDRYGPRRVMPLGAIILGLGLAASSQVTSLWQLYLTFGVAAAFGVSMLQSVPNTVIISNWFIRNRGTAIGIALAGSGFGQLWLTPATQWLIMEVGWRNTYLVLAPLIALPTTIAILLFLYHRPSDKGLMPYGETEEEKLKARHEVIVINREWADTSWTAGRAVRTFRFWAMAAMTAVFSFGFFLITPQLFVLSQDLSGFQTNAVVIALILGTGGMQKGVSKLIGGFISDRFGREKIVTASFSLVIAGIFLLNFVQTHPSGWLFLAAVLLYGLGYGLALPAVMASYADLFQGPRFGAILGLLTLSGLIGASVGTGLGGYLRDLTGGYQTNFLMSALAFTVAAALIWSARPSRIRTVRRIAAAGGKL